MQEAILKSSVFTEFLSQELLLISLQLQELVMMLFRLYITMFMIQPIQLV